MTIRDVPDAVGVASLVFSSLAAVNANVDMIIQNVSENLLTDISFTTPIADLDRISGVLEKLVEELDARRYEVNQSIAKVAIVGAGMRSNPGVAAKMFKTLADNDINIWMISTSAIRTSVVIDSDKVEQAVRCLHTAFGLDSKATFEETQLSGEELAAKAAKGR